VTTPDPEGRAPASPPAPRSASAVDPAPPAARSLDPHLRVLYLAAIAVAAALSGGCKGGAADHQVTVGAAASLRNAMPSLIQAYGKDHPGAQITATYGASGDLRKQVEAGAPIDAVIFAGNQPAQALIDADLAEPGSRKVLASNTLVLIGPKGAPKIGFANIESLPANEKIAIGDPGAVPAGQYAKEYLQKIGKWSAVEGRVVLGGDVAAVLAYARRGEVAAAIVYKTEVRGIDDVVVLDEPKDGPRAPVVGLLVRGNKAEAKAFLGFLDAPEGQKILGDSGFGPP
jgi:molybdate transport system substrate-binding protein